MDRVAVQRLAELERILTESEPAELRNYLSIPDPSSHFVARVMMIEMIPTNTRTPNMPRTNARPRLEGEAIRLQELV
ncbi:MAG TPA: hypothetical protein VF984_14465 [Actinomycetota bacterium]